MSSNRREVLENLQAHLLALLRVKLGGHHVIAPDAADEFAAVVSRRRDDRLIARHDVIAVHEVHARAVGEVVHQRRAPADAQLVPTHVWNFQASLLVDIKAHALAAEYSQAAVLAIL